MLRTAPSCLRRVTLLGLLLFVALAASGCGESQSERAVAAVFATLTAQPTATASLTATPTPSPTPTPTASPTATPTPAATPTPTFTATASPSPAPPSAAAIYAALAPSVAYVEVPDGSGSGVLVEGGYVVTNAHVVWPFHSVRLAFPNGEEFTAVPVLNQDHLADLAVLGPIRTQAPPVTFASGEHLEVGEEVYLIGYPGEADRFPQPALARGIVSRMRQWQSQGITFFQSDAAVAGGQSGGMFVSPAGEMIGISGFAFAEGNFALVASAHDLEQRVQRLIAGEDVDGLPERDLLTPGKRTRSSYRPRHYYDHRAWVVYEDVGEVVTVSAESAAPFFLAVVDPLGEVPFLEQTDEGPGGGTLEAEFSIEIDSPYFVVVGPGAEPEDQRISVSADRRVLEYVDPDDDTVLAPQSTLSGQIDYGGDIDVFRLPLKAGQAVTVTLDAIEIDPYLTVDYPGAWPSDVLYDDNSGGGLFSLNAQIAFVAAEERNYFLVVEDSSGYEFGGYQIRIETTE